MVSFYFSEHRLNLQTKISVTERRHKNLNEKKNIKKKQKIQNAVMVLRKEKKKRTTHPQIRLSEKKNFIINLSKNCSKW